MSARDTSFEDIPISDRAREVVAALGWRAPTPIQAEVVPQLAMGRDVIGRAQTGSGKTAAFGLHLTDAVKAPGVQALVLAPTRELATQIAGELNRLADRAPFRAVAIYGGVPYEEQIAALRDPDTTCIVATTGRLLDLLSRKQADLSLVRHVVIDEADRMLDLGFLPEVERVLRLIPGGRQTALFTATMPKKVAQLAHRYLAHARELEVGATTPSGAEHYRVDVPSSLKAEALVALLEAEKPKRALIFVRTRDNTERVARELRVAGHAATAFSGDLDQAGRERVVADLRSGAVGLVVATDVAARGLDIAGITHVINHDVPEDADTYVHRAGRTARAGHKGRVFTLVTEQDVNHASAAEKSANVKLKPYKLAVEGDDGESTRELTREARDAPPPPMRGGYAKGAKRKKAHTPPNPQRPLDKIETEEPSGPEREHELPRSRRRRKRDE